MSIPPTRLKASSFSTAHQRHETLDENKIKKGNVKSGQ